MADTSEGAGPVRQQAASPRIDAPHPLPTDTRARRPAPDALPAAIVAESAACASEQLQQQALELGEHLGRRQRELSHWESNLHAQAATWEDEQRANRLWLQERLVELAERESALDRRADELECRHRELGDVQAANTELQRRQRELDAWAGQLDARQAEVRAREQQQAWLDDHQEVVRLATMLRQQLQWVQQQYDAMVDEQNTWRDRTHRQRGRLAWHWQRRRHVAKTNQALLDRRRRQLAERRAMLSHWQQRLERERAALAADRPPHAGDDTGLRASSEFATIDKLAVRDPAAVATAAGLARQRDQLQLLVDRLACHRRELAERYELLQQLVGRQRQESERDFAVWEQIQEQLEDVEIRLAEARRDWFVQWRHACARLERWLSGSPASGVSSGGNPAAA